MDAHKRALPGDPQAGIPSEAWNGFLEAWEDFLRRRAKLTPDAIQGPGDGILIKNISGSTLSQFSIVSKGDPVIAPDGARASDTSFFGDAVFKSAAPVAGKLFAILQAPAQDQTIVPARLAGWSICKINVTDATHEFADCIAGNYTELASGDSGPARIWWRGEVPAAAAGDTLLTGVVAPSDMSDGVDGDWYLDTVADLYYGPKAGTWGAPTAEGTGVVWALVVFAGENAGFTGTKSVVTSVACSGGSSLRVTTEIWTFENGDYVSTESSSHQDFGCCCSDCPTCSIHYNVTFPGISTISGCADEMLTCAACATLTGCINLVSNAGPGDDLDHFIIGDGSTCNWLSSDSSGSAGDTATNKNLACDCNSSSVPLFVQLQFDPGTGHWFLYVGGGGAGVDPVVYELDTWDCASVGTFTLIDPGNYFCTGWPETVDVTPGAC